MALVFGATRLQSFTKIFALAALPEILTGIRLGLIRAVKGVIIGQLLVSVAGFGHLFEIYSSNFLMEHMWALLLVLFALAFAIDEALGYLERRVEYFASSSLFELRPGDLIMSGTPAGVGAIQRGDAMHGHVDGVGDMMAKVV